VIVPILDLRIKFQLSQANYDEFTVAIILNFAGRVVGVVVDSGVGRPDARDRVDPATPSSLPPRWIPSTSPGSRRSTSGC